MKNVFLLALLTLFISGCSFDGWEVNKAYNFCKEHGGVDFIIYMRDNGIACNDGAETSFYPK